MDSQTCRKSAWRVPAILIQPAGEVPNHSMSKLGAGWLPAWTMGSETWGRRKIMTHPAMTKHFSPEGVKPLPEGDAPFEVIASFVREMRGGHWGGGTPTVCL